MSHADRARAVSFGTDAMQYDRARPGYPAALFDELLVDDPRSAVDVGCGTGIVARSLLGRGCGVVGVEPDVRMAEVARATGVAVEVTTFEEWEPAGRTFDLLVSGQAWHWVDPTKGAHRAAAVLRPGARFGIFWNGLRHRPQVMAGFERIYAELAPDLLVDSVAMGTSSPSGESDEPAFVETGAFTRLERRSYSWERRYTTRDWLDELPTHSGHRLLPAPTLERILHEVGHLIDGLGGATVVTYTSAGLFGQRR